MSKDKRIPLPTHPKFKDITGQRFGRLVAQYPVGKQGNNYRWLCLCDCGNEHVVVNNALQNGNTQSCRCLQKEVAAELKTTHGMYGTPEYVAWGNMKVRCSNPNFKNADRYSERGIKVCDAWIDSFEAFYEHVGPRPSKNHSIDRIDNDGDYEPGNVRWATSRQQQNNTRQNVYLTYRGETLTVSQWARRLGINEGTLRGRKKAGWPDERIIEESVRESE